MTDERTQLAITLTLDPGFELLIDDIGISLFYKHLLIHGLHKVPSHRTTAKAECWSRAQRMQWYVRKLREDQFHTVKFIVATAPMRHAAVLDW